MKKSNLLLSYLLVLLLSSTNLIFAEDNNSIRIMPLGDSITYDNRLSDIDDPRPTSVRTGYRSHLWYMLQNAGMNVDFVGSRSAGEKVTPPFDPDNEGHPGWKSFDIAENTYGYMAQHQPDIVLLHIGTNDHGTFTGGVDDILKEIHRYSQDSGREIHVIVALIIDRKTHDEIIPLFNDNLKRVIASHIINGEKISMVDMYHDAGLTTADYADNTHPLDSGYAKMARLWYNEIMKPYNARLSVFPYTLVDALYIESIHIDQSAKNIDIITEVPNTGITF
jgi:hypothetical protein